MENNAIEANFLVVKVEDEVYDVVVFGSIPVLKAFQEVYHGFFVEQSAFDSLPVCVMPNFEKFEYAEAWKNYWIKAFSEPEKACKTCPTVNEMFQKIKSYSLPQES